MPKPIKIEVRMSNEQLITPGGLAMVGQLLNKTTLYETSDKLKTSERCNPRIKNSDVVGTQIGLLCQGKNDYAAVNEFKEEADFYSMILGIKSIPSEETLRQRMDQLSSQLRPVILKSNTELLKNTNPRKTRCLETYVPIDIDVTPFDNSNSKKEGVSLTYKKTMGYAPIFGYIGTEGFLLNTELREGSTHVQNGTETFLRETIKMAKKVTDAPLLLRMDSGNDSQDNLNICYEKETRADFIIKRNLRKESRNEWLSLAEEDETAEVTQPREGKTVYIGSTYRFVGNRETRIVYEITERTIKPDGQILMEPDIEVNTWWSSFPEEGEGSVTDGEIIKLYHDHGTCEQFHSEIKTDMDLERLPSGYFKTNAAILLLGMMAYNILRIIGQYSLLKDDAPLKRPVKRRRLKTVIQNLITMAVRVARHAGKTFFNLGNSNVWRLTFQRVYNTILHS